MSEASFPLPGPLPEHAVLQKDVGTWDADVVFRMPGGPEHRSRGAMTSRLIANGKWLVSDFRNETTGFDGHGVFGYDPTRRKYVGTWIDTGSPGIQQLEGDWDAQRRTMTMSCEATTPDGRPMTMRQVTEWTADDRQIFRCFIPMPAGEHEIMTVEYTRR